MCATLKTWEWPGYEARAITVLLFLTIFSHTIASTGVFRFGGILLHADRFKHINNVARMLLQETGLGLKVLHFGCMILWLFTSLIDFHAAG
jgi:hypothetical protein